MLDDDEKRVRNGDHPFTKAKRSNSDMLDRNELQTYASLEKMMGQINNKTAVIKKTKKYLLPFKGQIKLKTDRAVYRINPRTSGKEHWLEPRPDDRTYRTRARLSRPSKDHSRARISLGREEPEDGHTFPPVRPSRQSRTCPYLYPVHASGSMNLDSSRRVILDQSARKTESLTH
uniref:Uncharacterized protein n=1 Tax=Brassica oleracea var. oleracea TaxID=109376 RepID=A0A0D3CRQ0_BRAOL